MKVSDKQLGLVVILLIVGAILGVALAMVSKNQNASSNITVFFDEMGSLQKEDQVTSRGYPIGKVASVEWRDHKAVVELELQEPMILRSQTKIRNENYSLMGQRRIEIIPSREGEIVGKDYVFKGEFEPGIAEALHLMKKVREQMLVVRDVVFLLTQGDAQHPSVSQQTEKLLQQAEAMVEQSERLVEATAPWVKNTLQQTQNATQEIAQVTRQGDTLVNNVSLQSKQVTRELRTMLSSIQQRTASISAMMSALENNPQMHDLLFSTKMVDELKDLNQTVRGAMDLFDSTGNLDIKDLQGNSRPLLNLSNINLLGATAREKAKEHQGNE